MYLLQDWTTIAGNGTTPFAQSILDSADLARWGDVVLWLEVRAVSNPGAGDVRLHYQTSPVRDGTVFQSIASVLLSASATPVITKIRVMDNPDVPLARWLRWQLEGTASGDWSACFRILGCGGRSSVAAFDPATLNLTGWWRASYSGSPWTPTSSVGSSGSNGNLSEASNAPAAGTAVNGFTPADFTNAKLGSSVNNPTFFDATAWTIIVLFNADAAAADGAVYNNPSLWTDITGGVAGPVMSFSDAGVKAGHYDGAWRSVAVAAATGAWHLAFARYDGVNIEVGVDSGAFSSVSANGIVSFQNQPTRIGANYAETNYFDGKILEIMTADTPLTDGDRASVRGYFNARYGLSL